MAYGVECYNRAGIKTFTTAVPVGGVYAGKITAPANTNITIYLDGTSGNPNCIGKTVFLMEAGSGAHVWVLTQTSTPYVTFTKRTLSGYFGFYPTTLLVFAK